MTHDYSLVFDTESPYWQKVLDIFTKNEKYEKKVVSNRNLHHKFPRSFSKKLGEEVDNDKDNLISLSLADHFLVHYYYYLLAKKGYRQAMATAFTFMAKKCLKYITPETAEAMAKDYEEAKCIADQGRSEALKGHTVSDETRRKMTEAASRQFADPEQRKKLSEAQKGERNSMYGRTGEKHPMYGKKRSEEHRRKLSESLKGRTFSAETRQKMSKSQKGHAVSDETKRKIAEAAKVREAKRKAATNKY